jgi:MoaA/NifB/PqqE/SkfB family radical SAM enzyme
MLESDYKNLLERIADSTDESEIRDAINEEFGDAFDDEKEKAKEEIPPIFALSNTLKTSLEPEIKKLGILMVKSRVVFSYNSNETLKDPEKLEGLKKQLEDLEKYTKDTGSKNSVFKGNLNDDEREKILKLVNKVQARITEMSEAQNIEPSKLPGVSIPVIFGIIALTVALGGVMFYFLQSIYGKEPEEIQ